MTEPNDYGATVRSWTDLIRRARLGSTAKSIAMMLANYADSDGSRVFPGISRLSVECELSYKTVQAALEKLRRAGLVERVRRAGRSGQADEYRLTIGPQLLEHINVLSPTEVRLAMDSMRRPWGKRPRPTGRAEVDDEPQPSQGAEVGQESEETSAHLATGTDETSAHLADRPQPTGRPLTYQYRVTKPTDHSGSDLHTEVAVPAAAAVFEPLPSKCGHGLAARRKPSGDISCTLCRREAAIIDQSPNVFPIRRGA